MTRTALILAAAGGSVLLLAGAYAFQAAGYLPCAMCWWQRYPHFAAVVIGALALATRGPILPGLGALAALSTAAIGAYHTGVERDWWEGPASCTNTGGLDAALDGGSLLPSAADAGPRLVLCDQVAWELWGVSLPSWNAIFSLVLVGLWVMAARRSISRPA